jgi:splicing factor 1
MDPCNLIINFIPTPITDQHLHDLFAPYGELLSARVIKDRQTQHPLGYGFVKYRDPNAAAIAIRELDGARCLNKRLRVSVAQGFSQRQLAGFVDGQGSAQTTPMSGSNSPFGNSNGSTPGSGGSSTMHGAPRLVPAFPGAVGPNGTPPGGAFVMPGAPPPGFVPVQQFAPAGMMQPPPQGASVPPPHAMSATGQPLMLVQVQTAPGQPPQFAYVQANTAHMVPMQFAPPGMMPQQMMQSIPAMQAQQQAQHQQQQQQQQQQGGGATGSPNANTGFAVSSVPTPIGGEQLSKQQLQQGGAGAAGDAGGN